MGKSWSRPLGIYMMVARRPESIGYWRFSNLITFAARRSRHQPNIYININIKYISYNWWCCWQSRFYMLISFRAARRSSGQYRRSIYVFDRSHDSRLFPKTIPSNIRRLRGGHHRISIWVNDCAFWLKSAAPPPPPPQEPDSQFCIGTPLIFI